MKPDLFDIMNDMVFKLENGQVQENGKVLYVKDIMVKNVFELYPGGLEAAANNFEKAWGWANQYKFSSFINYAQKSDSPILQKDILEEVFKESEFKSSAREIILSRTWEKGDLRTLTAE